MATDNLKDDIDVHFSIGDLENSATAEDIRNSILKIAEEHTGGHVIIDVGGSKDLNASPSEGTEVNHVNITILASLKKLHGVLNEGSNTITITLTNVNSDLRLMISTLKLGSFFEIQ